MQNILLVIDMQNDFIDGALGTPEAVAIVPKVGNPGGRGHRTQSEGKDPKL